MSDLSSKITILKPTSTIADLVSSLLSKLTTIDDFAVVCDERNRLLGVINVQDILRSFTSGASMDTNVQNVMSTDPVTCRPGLDAEQIYHAVEFKISQKKEKPLPQDIYLLLMNQMSCLMFSISIISPVPPFLASQQQFMVLAL